MNEGHILISYARADGSDFALRLFDDLEMRRINAWIDIHNIEPGENFDNAIDRGIRQAIAVAVVLTPCAILSQQVTSEWNSALSQHIPVIPLLVIDCTIPRSLNVLNWIDFREEYDPGIAALRRRINRLYPDHLAYLQEQLQGYRTAQTNSAEPERFQSRITDLEKAIERWEALFAVVKQDHSHKRSTPTRRSASPEDGVTIDMRKIFVGRETELIQLDEYLNKTLQGEMQICFVAGDAGIGKTALITEFAQHVHKADSELLYVMGQCNDITGTSDAYLPFRHVLGLLTGDQSRLASATVNENNAGRLNGILKTTGRALVEIAPELVGTLIPGAGILVALGRLGAQERGMLKSLEEHAERTEKYKPDVEQSQIYMQYTALLRTIAQKHPLVIIIDDLQWADMASIGLLFHLVRELKQSRILLIGLYRPNEIVAGYDGDIHPLKDTLRKVLNEIKRYEADVVIDLNKTTQVTGRVFVDAVVDAFPNHLDTVFRDTLFQHTGGHALFTVELLAEMQDRGDLVQDKDGFWHTNETLDWKTLPDRVEAVVEERIERLEEELRETLTVASVEGLDFTAQVVARVRELKEKDLLRQLSRELEKRYQLVNEHGESRVGKTFLSRYSFSHALFHRYLYNSLSTGERRILHQAVAEILEELYAESTEQIATQLAQHYTEAGNIEKAVEYLINSADRKLRLGETKEAFVTLQHAMKLYEANTLDRPDLLMFLNYQSGRCYYYLSDRLQAKELLERALCISEQLDNTQMKIDSLLVLASVVDILDEKEKYHEYVTTAHQLAEKLGDEERLVKTLRQMAIFQKSTQNISTALIYYHQAFDLAIKTNNNFEQVESLNSLAVTYASIGELQKAMNYFQKGISIAQREGYLRPLGLLLANLAYRQRALGLYTEALENYQQALDIAKKIGSRSQEKTRLSAIGKMYLSLRDFDRAEKYFYEALVIADSLDSRASKVIAYRTMAELQLQRGCLDEAYRFIEVSLSYAGDETQLAWLIKGLIQIRRSNRGDAKESLEKAIAGLEMCQLKRNPNAIIYLFNHGVAFAGLSLAMNSQAEAYEYISKAQLSINKAISIAPHDKGTIQHRGIDMLDIIKPVDGGNLLAPLYSIMQAALANEA